jgi:hypothetical protein
MKNGSHRCPQNSVCPPILSTVGFWRMRTSENKTSAFQKVGECLYRYSPNAVYYARIKVDGKEIRSE